MRPVRAFAALLAFVFAFVTIASSTTKPQDDPHDQRSAAIAFQYWMAGPANSYASFSPESPDNWLGGTGNWSNGADWSAGEPGSNSDVTINTGNDNVTLDTNASINSLTLGGTSGSSTLSGDYNITIAWALTVNQTGTLDAVVTANGNSSNAGTISGGELQVNATLDNSGQIDALSVGANTLNNSGSILGDATGMVNAVTLNNSGNIELISVAATTVTNQSSGQIAAQSLQVSGNLTNQGSISGFMEASQFTIGGELINSGTFDAGSSFGSVGSINNSGGIFVGLSFDVNGNVTNSGGITVGDYDFGQFPSFYVRGILTNEQSGTLLVNGMFGGATAGVQSLINSGTVQVEYGASLSVSQNVMNSGTITTDYQGQGQGNTLSVGGTLTNTSTGVLSLGGTGDVANIGFISNAGSISIADGATLNVTGGSHAPENAIPGLLNSGIVDVAQGGTLIDALTYTQTSGQTTVDGTLQVAGRGIANFAGGSLYGDGTIEANTISNANFNIGDMPMTVGELGIHGNYTQGANGSLTFDIASLTSFDQLNVSGRASLNGLAMIDLLNGYIPQVGNMFDIMNFASSSGTFSMVVGLPINGSEHFVLEYNSTNLTLDVVAGPGQGAVSGHGSSNEEPYISDVTSGLNEANLSSLSPPASVPEPGSLVLFGSGVAGIAAMLRRKRLPGR